MKLFYPRSSIAAPDSLGLKRGQVAETLLGAFLLPQNPPHPGACCRSSSTRPSRSDFNSAHLRRYGTAAPAKPAAMEKGVSGTGFQNKRSPPQQVVRYRRAAVCVFTHLIQGFIYSLKDLEEESKNIDVKFNDNETFYLQ